MKIRLNAIRLGCFVSLLYLVLLLVPGGLFAECQVTLAWDANHPTPDGYRLFQRKSGDSYNYHNFTDVGLSTSRTVSGLTDNTTYHFVVRAYVGSEESGDSNEATYVCSGGDSGGSGAGVASNPPLQPVAVTPADQAMDVSLRPTLTTSKFIDHDAGDYHAKTRWVIYRLDDDACVLDTTSTSALTRLKVPASILSPFTSYYWTATYFDQNGDMSVPSQSCTFTTLQTADTGTDNTQNDAPAALSTSSSSGSSGGGSGGGGGCFIQTLFGKP
jgi:hypothetical protein